ncbi:multidrug resistance protein MdtO [Bryocella elongata]|uniref:Multidrug resistance protein MdtO n=1 Tax=Bryocella elongata TaxID=863522 RepID=A0A1H5UH36_9BACT|nr:FUSC family protein [Bryocella elongata]SEF73577.1 multidrug resistance protein MdtO [Bryocella elongata]
MPGEAQKGPIGSHGIESRSEGLGEWLREFLKQELTPYPGRGAVVARIVISATLTMILIVTFRIPGGVVGALSAFVLSRENLVATARSAAFMMLAFVIGALFIPVGARLLASPPETHFLWVACSLFIVFFMLRCLVQYGVATAFALVVANVIGIWYLPGPAERNVELTLWLVDATLIGVLVTVGVEVIYYALRKGDDLIDGLDIRLKLIEDLVACYATGKDISVTTKNGLAQYGFVGVGTLRRHVSRGNYSAEFRARMSALVSLVGRSVDFAAALASSYQRLPEQDEQRLLRLQRTIAEMRSCIKTKGSPCDSGLEPSPTAGTPLLSEIESMVSLMPTLFSKDTTPDPSLSLIEDAPDTNRIFIPDAFTNPEHLRYVLGGTLAAMLCYVLYVALDWPGLSTSVTTCVLTALTTIGSSRQKQILRVAGFLLGGVVAGMGAQIFVLPYIDSITGFALLFASATGVAAWLATSSSRLSYAGVQFAFAFYIVHLSEFTIQTSLSVARDRVLGVFLGITMMWLVFERLFPSSAADEMVRIFVINLRQLAELVSSTPRADDPASIVKVRRLRQEIYRRFGEVNAQMDAVPFETGAIREGDMAARDRIRRWQASLRSFYVIELPLLQFRVFGDLESQGRTFAKLENEVRAGCARIFNAVADDLQEQVTTRHHEPEIPVEVLEHLEAAQRGQDIKFTEREQALMRLTRTISQIVDRLQHEVSTEGLYETYASDAPSPASIVPKSA